MTIIGVMIIGAIFAPFISPYTDTEMDYTAPLQAPSHRHFFGTDNLGRDLFSRVIYASRTDLLIIMIVVPIAAVIGVLLGTLAGFLGGATDDIIMRITDMFMAIPYLVLTMAVAAALGPSLRSVIIAMLFAWWRGYARVARGETVSIREETYVEASRALGGGRFYILLRHILPNEMTPIIIYMSLDIGSAILTVSALSFLGYGVQPPTPEWGTLASEGRDYLVNQWWLATFPGLAIFGVVWGINLLGDRLRDVLDPRTRSMLH